MGIDTINRLTLNFMLKVRRPKVIKIIKNNKARKLNLLIPVLTKLQSLSVVLKDKLSSEIEKPEITPHFIYLMT